MVRWIALHTYLTNHDMKMWRQGGIGTSGHGGVQLFLDYPHRLWMLISLGFGEMLFVRCDLPPNILIAM
jgi:hypothetical protein